MKKKFLFVLSILAFALTSCTSDSSGNGFDSWVESKGVPTTYMVQTVTVNDLKPDSVGYFIDTLPRSADGLSVLGRVSNLSHELAFDIAIKADSAFLDEFKKSESSGLFMLINLNHKYYKAKQYPEDSLKIEDEMDLRVSWKFDHSGNKKFADSLAKISDSSWYASLENWDDAMVSDTTITVSLSKLDTSVIIEMPRAIVDSFLNTERYTRFQMKLSTPKATRLYRFWGTDTDYPPYFALYNSKSYLRVKPSRMANIIHDEEDCVECPVLHGGVMDSIVVKLPTEPILKALSDFYGDEFPVRTKEADVRQYVLLATLSMGRDDSNGSSELGLPIQVLVGSFIDSAGTDFRKMELYRLNNEQILEEGHQNLIFHKGDSLTLQLTYGLRDFINRAADQHDLRFMMRLSRPFLQEMDTAYSAYLNDNGDTVKLTMDYFDYARYDFSSILESPMTLKLWLASKRELKKEEE